MSDRLADRNDATLPRGLAEREDATLPSGLAERIDATLRSQADSIVDGPRFSPADVIHAGRGAVARRRAATVGSAGVGVAAAVTAILVVGPWVVPDEREIAAQASPTGAVDLSAPAIAPKDDPARPPDLGLDLLVGNIVVRADGERVALELPPGAVTRRGVRVPTGLLLEVFAEEGPVLWFLPDRGTLRRIARLFGDFEVSPDGAVVVATVTEPVTSVVAYSLPDLTLLRYTALDAAQRSFVAGVAGGRAVLHGAEASAATVWDLRTGALKSTVDDVWTMGMAATGEVLRRVDQPGATPCLNVVGIGLTVPVDRSGACRAELAEVKTGQLAPSGAAAWLVVESDQRVSHGPILVRTADLRAGHWRPVPLDQPDLFVKFWDSGATLIAGNSDDSRFFRCDLTGHCAEVMLPPDTAGGLPVARAG